MFKALVITMLVAAAGVDQAPKPPRVGLQINLRQKLKDGTVRPVAPDHVFEQGDLVQFQLEGESDGYLYVLNAGSSGRYDNVFPSMQAGSDNRVRRAEAFNIPTGDDNWFQISGPAGFDVLYFLLSPESIASPPASAYTLPVPLSSLKPRCNDAIFKARGECTDVTAGAAPLPPNAPLPPPMAPIAGAASRDITVVKKQDGVSVGSAARRSAPVIYTFRLAHR